MLKRCMDHWNAFNPLATKQSGGTPPVAGARMVYTASSVTGIGLCALKCWDFQL